MPDPTSCVFTGAHYMRLPPATGSRSTGSIFGECVNCGFVKRYPAGWRGSRSGKGKTRRTEQPVRVWELPAVVSDGIGWGAAVDGVFHLRQGAIRDLERVALQLEASSLFADRFVRNLEVIGDIDIERDAATLRPIAWEASPTTLAGLADGTWLLVGRRSRHMSTLLGGLAADYGGGVSGMTEAVGPPRTILNLPAASSIHSLAVNLSEASELDVHVSEDAGAAIASVLPPLSTVLAGLPRVPVPAARRIRQWDAAVARWSDVRRADRPGSYQFWGFSRRYGIRSDEDMDSHSMALADSRTARYVGALRSGHPLVVFNESSNLLVVPLGADLPGLYGRAAALAGGYLPVPDEAKGVAIYRGVPRPVADALMHAVFS
jgi:hypothetical protein